jgi:hypothetical protein
MSRMHWLRVKFTDERWSAIEVEGVGWNIVPEPHPSLRQKRVSPSPYRAGRAVDAEGVTQLHNPLLPGQDGRLEFDRYTWSQESRWMLIQQFSAR